MKPFFKQIVFILFISALFAWAQSDILVEAFDEQWNNPSQITLRLRLTNSSQDTLTNVRLRYFLGHDENRTLELSPYYLTNANVYLDTIDNYLAVNIDIPQVVPGTYPNSSGISLGLRYQDNNIFHKNGNFSYPGTSGFEPTSNIPVYVDNMYMAGNTPVGDEIPKVHFYGIQPEAFGDCPAWVELKNDGPLDVSLKDFYLKSSSSDSLALLDAKLLAGQKIRICNTNDIQKCPQEDLVQISDSVDFNNYENFSIVWNGNILENIPYGDGIRAELDIDSDHANDNGTWDGFEDLNHNGILDDGETDPYNVLDDTSSTIDLRPLTEWDIPDSLTIYSIGGLYLNDRSKCYDGDSFCNIASESGKIHHAVSIGVNSKIGSLISMGGIGLRNRASVFGNIDIYSLPNNYAPIELQESANLYGDTSYHRYMNWPYRVIDGEEHHIDSILGTSELVVHNGQLAILNDGDHFRSVRVMYGGKLKVNPGQMYVGNIQLESGSQLEFLEPGKETVIHAEGSFIWRANLLNEDKVLVARGFKLIQYGEQPVFVEGEWAGTIHAARAQLILGQTVKSVYGRFLGKGVTVHQNTDVFRVDFDPIRSALEISYK